MKARREDLAGLLHIQKIDVDLLKLRKQFEELPQRGVIMAARQKKASIEEKGRKVADLRKEAQKRLSRIADEDASLAGKAAAVQGAIEAAQGDYRNVEARTKELDGIAKRRATLADNRTREEAELAKIEDIEAQVALALEEVERQEKHAVSSFQEKGGALKGAIAQYEADRARIAAEVDGELLARYEKVARSSGGVAIGVLNGSQCGVCRAQIEKGRLVDLKSQAPLGVCPSCKRLLIVG